MPQSSNLPPANNTDAARSSGGPALSDGDGLGSQRTGTSRPGGSKAAKEESRIASAREGALYAQAAATRTMAEAQMKKAALLEDHNMLLLMTMPEDKITTVEAREYMRLRRGDELKKLRRKLAAEEERERQDAASAHEEVARSSATKRGRCVQAGSDYEEGEGSQPGCSGYGEGNDLGDRAEAVTVEGDPAAGSQQEGAGSLGDAEDDGDGDCVISLAQVSRRKSTAAASLHGRSARDFCSERAANVGVACTQRRWAEFDVATGAATELRSGSVTEPDLQAGMWAQTRSVAQSNAGVNADAGLGVIRDWLHMDRVDPCQPTQACNLGSVMMQDNNVNWTGTHSSRMQGNGVAVDKYVEAGQDNVDVRLSLHGQFY